MFKYKERLNCDGLSIRIFTSHSSFFSRQIPGQIVKPLKKPNPVKTGNLESQLDSQRESLTAQLKENEAQLPMEFFKTLGLVLKEMQLATCPIQRKGV